MQNGWRKMESSNMNHPFFKDKIVVITGSSMGIGKSLALKLAQMGSKVVLNGRNKERLDQTFKEFCDQNFDALAINGDISNPYDCELLISKTIEKYGSIDIIVNNAGISSFGDVDDLTPETARKVMDVNYLGSHFVSHYAIPYLKKSKGHLIFIGSLAGIFGLPSFSVYSASKMALTSLAESLKIELNTFGIHVGIIYLGFTKNDTDKMMLDKSGSLIPQRNNSEFKPVPREIVVSQILNHIQKRTFKSVLTPLGKIMVFINKFFPSLLTTILTRTYNQKS